jgi:hypothetical protein
VTANNKKQIKQFERIVACSETQEFSASQKQPIKEQDLMIEILNIGSPECFLDISKSKAIFFKPETKQK